MVHLTPPPALGLPNHLNIMGKVIRCVGGGGGGRSKMLKTNPQVDLRGVFQWTAVGEAVRLSTIRITGVNGSRHARNLSL